ncbi:MAG TPA: VOC family protein [Burkholderiales bacterium]|nr:VOC family protein [Burkholderiales bacterium]
MDQRPAPGELCLDHVAHFVPDLQAAASALEKLGLVVTPESAHRTQHGPAGTSNRCLMLEAGYVEILAPTLDTPNAQRVRDRMQRHIGMHLCCFGTPDPAGEHARLAANGFEPEPLVNLARNLQDGTPVRFNVVYVPPEKMPEGRIQYCEHLTEGEMWRDSWVNRGLRLDAAFVVADDPAEVAARWALYTGVLPRREGAFVQLSLARGKVLIGTRKALAAHLGEAPPAPALAGYALKCSQPAAFLARCKTAGFAVSGKNVKLPDSLGGVWVIG